jgi:hypothetical protein
VLRDLGLALFILNRIEESLSKGYYKDMEKEPKIEKKKPIVDIEVNSDVMEEWANLGLGSEIVGDLACGFNDLVPSGEKFVFHTANFESTSWFMEKTEHTFAEFSAKNRDKKIKEVNDSVRKVILNFAFQELGFDPKNPQLVKEEKAKENKKEITIRYFATNQPNMFLVFDGRDWWLESETLKN